MPNPVWIPLASVQQSAVLLDTNGNVQQATVAGTTGSTPPTWNNTLNGPTFDGTVTWICVIVLEQPELPTNIATLPLPLFLNDADGLDPNLILQDMISEFQQASGRTLFPAQVERLLINEFAYREALVRNRVQYTGLQSMLAFAVYPMIDYLGQLVGVSRLAAQPAITILQFTLTQVLNIATTIPGGTLVGTADGNFSFSTDNDLTIPAGSLTGTVNATCTLAGSDANDYAAGQVNTLLSPNSIISAVANTTVTADGGSIETDDHLRVRIQAAPNRFSVAGPIGAYKFWALSADPSIIDVQVTTPVPGTVDIYVLIGPITVQPASSPNTAGVASSELLTDVLEIVNADSVRPLTDTVNVFAVTEINYTIQATLTLYSDADVTTSTSLANQAATNFALALAGRIQRDIVPEEIEALLGTVPGVYRVQMTQPTYTQATTGQWANCTAITLTIVVGTEHS